jgi:hypothetical protein
MENEIIEYKAGELASQKVHFERTGLVIDKVTSFKEWEEIGTFLQEAEKSVWWWIGDWLNFGERKFGETYTQALQETEYSYASLRKMKAVSERFEMGTRRAHLAWGHHKSVMYMEPQEREYWLDYAEENKIGERALQRAISIARLKEEGSNYDNLVDFIDHIKMYSNEILQLADALHDKRIYVSPNQKQIILDQASLNHGLWDNLEYELRKGI